MLIATCSLQVLVHGEQNEMMRLKGALQREYEDDETCRLELWTPKNCESINVRFKGEKVAKVLGSLAKARNEFDGRGQRLSGVLVKKNFAYHIMTPSELPRKSSSLFTTNCKLYENIFQLNP